MISEYKMHFPNKKGSKEQRKGRRDKKDILMDIFVP